MRWILAATVLIGGLVVMVSAESLENSQSNHTSNPDCLACHESEFQGQNSHMSESNDDCLFCHAVETRVVDGPESLRTTVDTQAGNYACVACHVEQDHSNQQASGHSDMLCTSCHSPHSSNYNHLFVTSESELCGRSCHGKSDIGITHPVGDAIDDVFAGQTMSCISTCHSMHEPEDDKLLQVAYGDLCHRCHPEKG